MARSVGGMSDERRNTDAMLAPLRLPADIEARIDRLSDRERQCLDRAALRIPHKTIARELEIEVGTIDGYLSSGSRKLGLQRREALRLFIEMRSPVNPGGPSEKPGMVGAPPFAPVEARVDRGATDVLNDIAVDHARTDDGGKGVSRSTFVRDILGGLRPEDLSFATRNALILAAIIVAGAAMFALSVALALLAPLVNLVRALFP